MAKALSSSNHSLPINVLRTKTKRQICDALNTQMILPTDSGLLRDWRGLAELIGINIALLEKQSNPTEQLFQLVENNDEHNKFTIHSFISYLEALDRFDIIDDYNDLIEYDIKEYCSIQNEIDNTVYLPKSQSYDAMVLYAEKDADFAYNLVDTMEKSYKMNIFIKDRNLKAGDKEVQATLSVIADISNKLIVVLSPDFLTSPMNEFFLDYAQTIGIEQKTRKIIPCILTHCQLPKQLLGLHSLTYTTNCRWGSFWSRLADSLDTKVKTTLAERCNDSSDSKEMLNTNSASSLYDSNQQYSILKECSKEESTLSSTYLPTCPDDWTALKGQSVAASSSSTRYEVANSEAASCSSKNKNKQRKLRVSAFLNKVTKILPKSDKIKIKEKSKKGKAIAVAM